MRPLNRAHLGTRTKVGLRCRAGQTSGKTSEALLKEVETGVADLLENVSDMDDLVVQFDGSDAGKRLIEAWKRARIIVDTGGGQGGGGTPPTPPTPPPA